MKHALGVSVHTGWGACVVVGGTPAKPVIVRNEVIEILGDDERFCYHMAAEMKRADAAAWIERLRKKALANARQALARLVGKDVVAVAIVAKEGDPGDLDKVLGSHPLIHMAEGCFYRDVLREACPVPARVVPPKSLDISGVGKIAPPPWGKDQKLAALAAWRVLGRRD
jgi:hypothetical protein